MSRSFRLFRSILTPKALLYAVLLPALFLAGSLTFLQSGTGNSILRTSLEGMLPNIFPNMKLKIEALDTDILTGVHLEGLSLRLKGKEAPLLSLEDLDLEWHLLSYLSEGKIRLFVSLSGMEVYVKEKNGELNWTTLFASDDPETQESKTTWPELPFHLEIPIIDFNQTRVEWEDLPVDIDIEASLSWNRKDIDLQLHQIQAHMPAIGDLDSRIDINGNSQLINMDIALQQKDRGLEISGTIEDVIGDGILGIRSRVYCKKGCLEDLTNQDIPQIDQEILLAIQGDFTEIISTATIGSGFPLEVRVTPREEVWSLSWKWQDFKLNDWVGDLEPINLKGEYSIEGHGFSLAETMFAEIEGTAPTQDIWNETLDAWILAATLDKGILDIQSFALTHSMGDVDISGSLNLLESQGTLVAGLALDDFRYLDKFEIPAIQANVRGAPAFQLNWKDEPKIRVEGAIDIQALKTEYGSFREMKATIAGDIDAEQAIFTLENEIAYLNATGVEMPKLDLDIDVIATFSGKTEATGTFYSNMTKVEEGVVLLHGVQGEFLFEMDEELLFQTKDMHVGEVELAPVQYKIDGGPIFLELKGDNLIADLHLLRKQKTFINIQAKSDLKEEMWWINRLIFSPTEGEEWGMTEGVVFQVSDKGVENFKLSLISEAGEVSVFADTNNNSPDFSVQLKNVEVKYAAELVELFGGIEDIPENSSGLIQGMFHVQGLDGYFGDEDFLIIQNLIIPGLVEEIDAALDLKGKISAPKLKLVVSSAVSKDEIFRMNGTWPLNLDDGFAIDCEGYGQLQFQFPETNWKNWNGYFPSTPEMDISFGLQARIKGKACRPSLQLSGMTRSPMGVKKSHIRTDWQAIFENGTLNFTALVEENLQPLLVVSGDVQTDLEEPIEHFLETMEWIEPKEWVEIGYVDLQPKDLHLNRILPLIDLDGMMSGEIVGAVSLQGNLSELYGMGQLKLIDGMIGSEAIESWDIDWMLNQEQADVELRAKIGKSGTIDLTAMIPFADDRELDVSANLLSLPFAIAETLISDIQDSEGTISSTVTVGGTLSAPIVNARLSGRNISFQNQYLGTKFRTLKTDVLVADNQINLQNLSGEVSSIQSINALLEEGWGQFELKGTLSSGASIQSNWELKLTDCTLIDNQLAHFVVSGMIEAEQNEEAFLDGEIFVHKGRAYFSKDFFTDSASLDLNPKLKIHRTGVVQRKDENSMEWLDDILANLDGDIGIDLGERVSIKAEMPMAEEYGQSFASLSTVKIETALRGAIDLGWTQGEPIVTGALSAIRGEFTTMTRDFSIEEGEIIFTGGDVYNPRLALTAQKTFGGYGDIVVYLGGTVEEMTLEFESKNGPEIYDQTDILSLILLGKPAKEMADAESQSSSLLLTAGLKTMSGAVGDALGSGQVLDQIDWDPTADLFEIGKSLNDTMFLSYSKVNEPDEGENENEITLEWLILKRVYAEFITGDANNSQVSVYYRWIF